MKKLKSQNGASISFALLLFLVCATAGAVVLAAGTAAAGRLSQMVNMDKRYYSASSAAALLAKEIEGKVVTIERSLVETVVETTTYNKDGELKETKFDFVLDYETDVNGKTNKKRRVTGKGSSLYDRPESEGSTIDDVTSSFLSRQACYLMFEANMSGQLICNTDAAMQKSFGISTKNGPTDFELKGTGDLATVTISGKATLNIDGSLDFEIGSEVDGATYTLILRMIPNINESPSSSMNSEPSYSYGADGSYTERITTTETTTITSTISWNVESIQKKVSDFKPTPSGTP